MVKISGFVYLIIGALVAFFSKLVDNSTDSNTLVIFFYVGLIFVAIGVFKIVLKLIIKEKKSDSSFLTGIVNKDLPKINSPNNPKQIVSCSKCGTRHYSTSNFCHKCGNNLN